MKLGTVLDSAQAMHELAGMKLPIKTAYRVSKAIRLIDQEFKHFDEMRVKTLNEVAIPPIDNPLGEYSFADDAAKKLFTDRMNELKDSEITIEGLLPITYADLAGRDISAQLLVFLDGWFITGSPEDSGE